MRKKLAKRQAAVLAAFAVALLATAAGCGGGGGETQPAAPATSAATTPAQTSPAETSAPETAPATTAEAAPATLKLALDWFPNPDHVSLFYALHHGDWKNQNLTVEMKTPSDPTAGLKLVAANKFDLAIYYESELFFAAEQKLPVITVATLIPNPLNSLIASGDSKVKGPSTIKGAKIGVAGLPTDDAILATIRKKEGLSESDVTSVNVGFNLVPAVLSHKVDAIIGGYRNVEGIQISQESGKPATIISLDQVGIPHFDELVIVANKDRLQSDPAYADAVRRFIAGMVKGYEGATADPQGALAEQKEDTKDYSDKFLAESVPETIGLLKPPDSTPYSCINLDQWSTYGKWMLDNGLLKQPIDVSQVATNDYNDAC
jgi:putative hydroxymethylpyrimidine transport system substrate-binding protein